MSEEIKSNKIENIKSLEERQKIAKKLSKKMQEIDVIYNIEDMIKDNKIYFDYNNQEYRIRKSTRQEKRKMGEIKTQKFNQLLQDTDKNGKPKYILREQLIDMYEKRGINLSKMNQELTELAHKEENKLLILAKTDNEKQIKILKDEVQEFRNEQTDISIRKADLLEFSLEDTLKEFMNTYLCHLLLEKKEKDNWVRVFKTHTDFINSENEELITRGLYFLVRLMRNDIF